MAHSFTISRGYSIFSACIIRARRAESADKTGFCASLQQLNVIWLFSDFVATFTSYFQLYIHFSNISALSLDWCAMNDFRAYHHSAKSPYASACWLADIYFVILSSPLSMPIIRKRCHFARGLKTLSIAVTELSQLKPAMSDCGRFHITRLQIVTYFLHMPRMFPCQPKCLRIPLFFQLGAWNWPPPIELLPFTYTPVIEICAIFFWCLRESDYWYIDISFYLLYTFDACTRYRLPPPRISFTFHGEPYDKISLTFLLRDNTLHVILLDTRCLRWITFRDAFIFVSLFAATPPPTVFSLSGRVAADTALSLAIFKHEI